MLPGRVPASPGADCGPFLRLLLVAVCLALTASGALQAQSSLKSRFDTEKHEIETGVALHQTVLTGRWLENEVLDLAVVSVAAEGDRSLRLYEFENGTWRARPDLELSRDLLFVDSLAVGKRDRLIAYRPGRLVWIDVVSGIERDLVPISSELEAHPDGALPRVRLARDVNGDRLDDLLVPDVDGFWVFIQSHDGSFATAVKLGPPFPRDELYGTAAFRSDPWQHSRIHRTDHDRDGHFDLIYWNQDHFLIHQQDRRGRFREAGTRVDAQVRFDSDDLHSLVAPHGVARRGMDRAAEGALTGRVLHSLADHNGDGVSDLAVFSLSGGSLWKMRYSYEVYFGSPVGQGTTYATQPSTVIQSKGIPFTVREGDLNGDGLLEIAFTRIRVGAAKVVPMILGAAISGSVSADLTFYRLDSGRYTEQPTVKRKVKVGVRVKPGESVLFPSTLLGDVDGDGLSDLLIGRPGKKLRVLLGYNSPRMFVREVRKISVRMPRRPEHSWLVDVNLDGRDDVLLYHPSDGGSHRITVLLSR